VIELGVPFSDPSADGVSIQRAMERVAAARASAARSTRSPSCGVAA
jgi:tryptophan synthase alpha subunit